MIEEIAVLGILGFAFAIGLIFASRKFAVQMDARVEQVRGTLPGLDCGACGFGGCNDYASAVVKDPSLVCACKQIDADERKEIGKVLGIDVKETMPTFARLSCTGGSNVAFEYRGVQSCAVAASTVGGFLECKYGCLGFGDCVEVCAFDAIRMVDGLPQIDKKKCTGCAQCVRICPKKVIKLQPDDVKVFLFCNSPEPARVKARMCKKGCIACNICERVCPVHAIKMVNNLPEIDQVTCTACGECVEKCPRHVLELAKPISISSTKPTEAQVTT